MNPTSRTPWLTLVLIAANVIPAFVLYFDPAGVERLGFRPDSPSLFAALVAMFLHLNVIHLLGNMVFLAAVGPLVESAVGWVRFFLVYLTGGLAGAYIHALMRARAGDHEPLIGASGAIAACIGYVAIRYMGRKVPVAPKIQVGVWVVAAIWLGLQVAGAFVRLGDPGGGVAFWAHLGGFAVGVVFSLIFKAPNLAHQEIGHQTMRRMADRSPGAILAAADRHLLDHPNDARAWWEKADAHRDLNDTPQETVALLRLFDLTSGADQAEVIERLGVDGALRQIPSLKRVTAAKKLEQTHFPSAARMLYESVVAEPLRDGQRPEALFELARLEGAQERPERAAALLDTLVRDHPLHSATELARAKGLVP